MSIFEIDIFKLAKPILHKIPPEASHNLAIWALEKGLVPSQSPYKNKKLESNLFGLHFQNPVGLAAGFDKDARCIESLSKQNFGFIEVGTTTPQPQSGNMKPRLFRFPKEQAIVNRFGFNNNGLELFTQKLRHWKYTNHENKECLVGANIGRNKTSKNNSKDYIQCLEKVYGLCDYVTVNISSPNTPNLRDLLKPENLSKFLGSILKKRKEIESNYKGYVPILLKISPDEDDEVLQNIAMVCLKKKIDGVIISNTSAKLPLYGEEGDGNYRPEGGLSGKPLFNLSTEILRKFYKYTEGKIPLIGVGGISSAQDAYEKIKAGASLVQVYSALIYQGFSLVNEINHGLVELLKKDGYKNISEAIGKDNF